MAVMTPRHRRWFAALGGSIIVGALFAWLPVGTSAADLRRGPSVTLRQGQTINDDIYAAGGTLSIDGNVTGSVIAAGGTIPVSGTVTRDVMVAGGTINVTGKVGGSIRAAGGNLTITGPVEQDVVVTGGTVDIASGGTIGRDLVIAGGTATVAAPVARRVTMGAGDLTLRGRVGGDVRGSVDRLRLDGAQIGGNLDYTSDHSVVLANGASVAGTTTRHTPTARGTGAVAGGFLGWLRGLIGIFALGVLLLLLLPRFSTRSIDILRAEPWASLGIGAAILGATPLVALIVFIVGLLVGGWRLGLLLVPLWILALAIGYVVSGFLLGRLIFARLGWGQYHDILALLGGLFAPTVVGLGPLIGLPVNPAAFAAGAGAVALAVRRWG